MTLKQIIRIALVSASWMLPTALWAQSTGSIAGLVTDASGAVVPGVTVEASGPALIERARSVMTESTISSTRLMSAPRRSGTARSIRCRRI